MDVTAKRTRAQTKLDKELANEAHQVASQAAHWTGFGVSEPKGFRNLGRKVRSLRELAVQLAHGKVGREWMRDHQLESLRDSVREEMEYLRQALAADRVAMAKRVASEVLYIRELVGLQDRDLIEGLEGYAKYLADQGEQVYWRGQIHQRKAMSEQLFDDLVRLAASEPQMQDDLLPLLERHAFFRKKKPGTYQDYVKDKKRKGEKPMPKDEWESKTQGKGKKDKGGDKAEKGKQRLLDRGIMKFKPTPENVAAVGKQIVDSVKGDSLDLAQKYNLKELRKLEKQLKAIEDVSRKGKSPISIARPMKQIQHALNMKGRGIGKKAALEAYLRAELVRVASENPGQVQDDLLDFLDR